MAPDAKLRSTKSQSIMKQSRRKDLFCFLWCFYWGFFTSMIWKISHISHSIKGARFSVPHPKKVDIYYPHFSDIQQIHQCKFKTTCQPPEMSTTEKTFWLITVLKLSIFLLIQVSASQHSPFHTREKSIHQTQQ